MREFFDLELLSAGQWFLALLAAAIGLTIASLFWRLPEIEPGKPGGPTSALASSLGHVQSTLPLSSLICLVRTPLAGCLVRHGILYYGP